MQRGQRLARELVQAAGLDLLEMAVSGGSHLRVTIRRPDGATVVSFFALTPSDRRGQLNKLAELRRFARGAFNPITERKQ